MAGIFVHQSRFKLMNMWWIRNMLLLPCFQLVYHATRDLRVFFPPQICQEAQSCDGSIQPCLLCCRYNPQCWAANHRVEKVRGYLWISCLMGVSKNRDTPKWMVYNGNPYILKWMIWGYHYFWKHPHRGRGHRSRSGTFLLLPKTPMLSDSPTVLRFEPMLKGFYGPFSPENRSNQTWFDENLDILTADGSGPDSTYPAGFWVETFQATSDPSCTSSGARAWIFGSHHSWEVDTHSKGTDGVYLISLLMGDSKVSRVLSCRDNTPVSSKGMSRTES